MKKIRDVCLARNGATNIRCFLWPPFILGILWGKQFCEDLEPGQPLHLLVPVRFAWVISCISDAFGN